MFNYLIYRIGQFIALHLPLSLSYRIAILVSDLRCLFVFRDRRVVTENLKAIFPDMPVRQIVKLRVRVFRNFAKYLVDFFRFDKIDVEYIRRNVKVENITYLDEALLKGKGAVAVSAHIGNWELGGVVIALLGYPFWAVALPHKYKKVDDFFNHQRQNKGMRVIPLGKAGRKCLEVFAHNEIVALAGDRDFSGRGFTFDFFGRPAIFPSGPAAFASRNGVPLVPGFMVRNPDDSFTLRMEKPIYFTGTGDKQKDLLDAARQYTAIIEDYIRKYPDQWYMFRRFWIEE